MDNRTLIAFGMLLALVAFALQKRAVDGNAVEKIVIFLSGGITGAMNPLAARPIDNKSAARAAAVFLLIFGAAMLHGCATTEPYTGPPGPPRLEATEWLWLDLNGHLRRETTQHVINASYEPVERILDCDPHPKALRKWPGTRLTLSIPARTVQHVLLAPHDHLCSLLPADAEDTAR